MKNKLVIIGLDGVTLKILEPWMEEGKIPHIAELAHRGAVSRLESTPEKMSPAAWTSLATGLNPGRHGIFHFFVVDPETLRIRFINATHRKARTLWDLAGNAGKRVCVINVPSTYPANPVNGLMISGWDAPSVHNEAFTYPPDLIHEILQLYPEYPLTPSIKKYCSSQPELAIRDMHRTLDLRMDISRHLFRREDWDLFITVFTETDQIQHFFWHLLDKSHPLYREAEFRRLEEGILGVYQKCDQYIGEMIQEGGDETTVMVVSDHGAGINSLGVRYLPVILERTGFLRKRQKDGGIPSVVADFFQRNSFRLSRMISYDWRRRIKKLLPDTMGTGPESIRNRYEWKRTQAYPVGSNLRVNVKGREKYGTVSPGKEYDSVVADLRHILMACIDLKTGKPIVTDVVRKEDAYRGPHMEDAPDLILKWTEDYVISGICIKKQNGMEIRIPNLPVFGNDAEWTGEHSHEGIFLAKGPDIRPGCRGFHPHIMDITPSALHLMGVMVPENLDGRILTELFPSTPRVSDGESEMSCSDLEKIASKFYSNQEEREMKKRLQDLGYLD